MKLSKVLTKLRFDEVQLDFTEMSALCALVEKYVDAFLRVKTT